MHKPDATLAGYLAERSLHPIELINFLNRAIIREETEGVSKNDYQRKLELSQAHLLVLVLQRQYRIRDYYDRDLGHLVPPIIDLENLN